MLALPNRIEEQIQRWTNPIGTPSRLDLLTLVFQTDQYCHRLPVPLPGLCGQTIRAPANGGIKGLSERIKLQPFPVLPLYLPPVSFHRKPNNLKRIHRHDGDGLVGAIDRTNRSAWETQQSNLLNGRDE
jgi:hypothetical protein